MEGADGEPLGHGAIVVNGSLRTVAANESVITALARRSRIVNDVAEKCPALATRQVCNSQLKEREYGPSTAAKTSWKAALLISRQEKLVEETGGGKFTTPTVYGPSVNGCLDMGSNTQG